MDNANKMSTPQTPKLCVDLIVDMGAGMVVMLDRNNDPKGWALPGGFVEQGESVEEAAIRECYEETGLDVELIRQFHVYSNPKRDPRGTSASVVFLAKPIGGKLRKDQESKQIESYHMGNLPSEIAFDHREILNDYFLERF